MNTTQTYNGKTLAEILDKLPKGMIDSHASEYVSNIEEIQSIEASGYNDDRAKQLRYRNFIIINYYNSL